METDPNASAQTIYWREPLLVLGAGAIGGLLSLLYAITVGEPPKEGMSVTVPAWLALGMGASFIGVYLIASTDTKAILRCLAFALVCGFAWKPIYEAGHALIDKQAAEKHKRVLQEVTKQTSALIDSVKTTSLEARAEKLTELTNKAKELLTITRFVDNYETRTAAEVVAKRVVDVIAGQSDDHPTVVAGAFDTLGYAAVAAGNSEFVDYVINGAGSDALTKTSPESLVHLASAYSNVRQSAISFKNSTVAVDAFTKSLEAMLTAAQTKAPDWEGWESAPYTAKVAYSDLASVAQFYQRIGDEKKALKLKYAFDKYRDWYSQDDRWRSIFLDSIASQCRSLAVDSVAPKDVGFVLKRALESPEKPRR